MYFLLKDEETKIQFVFSHITKNAGSTIRGCADNSCNDSLFTQLDKSNEIKPEWKYSFSFIIHRDPYSRFLSAFSDFKDNRKHNITLDSVTRSLENFDYEKAISNPSSLEHHLLQQTNELWGEKKVDYVLSYENLNNDLESLLKKFNIRKKLNLQNRPSKSKSYFNKLNSNHIHRINQFYNEDFRKFGYKKIIETKEFITPLMILISMLFTVNFVRDRTSYKLKELLFVFFISICTVSYVEYKKRWNKKNIFYDEYSIYISKFHLFAHVNPQYFINSVPTMENMPKEYYSFNPDEYYKYFSASFYRNDDILKQFNDTKNANLFSKYSNPNYNIMNMVVFLRRTKREDERAKTVFANLRNYILENKAFVLRMIDARHLISIAKTFLQHGEGIEKQNALLLNILGVEYKLMLTYKNMDKVGYTFKNNKGPQQPFNFEANEDVLNNEFINLLKSELLKTPTIFILWKAFYRWVILYDNCILRKVLLTNVDGRNIYKREMCNMIFSDDLS